MERALLGRWLKQALLLGSFVATLLTLTAVTALAAPMDVTQNDVCISCHATPVNAPIKGKPTTTWYDGSTPWPTTNFSDIHNIKISKGHSFVCFNCHNMDFKINSGYECGECHRGSWPVNVHAEDNLPYRTNYFTTSFYDSWENSRSDASKYQVTYPRTNTDCYYCHQQSKVTHPTPVVAKHDINQAHKISFPDSSCQECHTDELTLEHTATGRKDALGKTVGCITCHGGATKAKIPNYQPYRLRVSEPNEGTVGQFVYHEEYTIPGKELLGARISILTDLKTNFTLEAFYDGQWNKVFSRDVTRKDVPTPGDYGHRTYSLTYALSEQITFSKAATKLRVISTTLASERYAEGVIYDNVFEVKLDNWVFANPDAKITCSSCHDTANHLARHDTGFDSRCTNCHDSNLQKEHLSKNVTCAQCHEGGATVLKAADIKETLAWNQKECSNCHTTGHTEALSPVLPSDIPVLSPPYTWTAPLPVALFTGEGGIPVEAVVYGGKMIMSNRMPDIFYSPSFVWDFYKNKMQELGWTLVSGGQFLKSNDTWKATFRKGNKNAMLWYYDFETRTGGLHEEGGYKLDMLYWTTPVLPPAEPVTAPQLPNIGLASNGSVTMANVPLTAVPDTVYDLTIEFWAKTNYKDGLAYRTIPLDDYNNLGLYLPWNDGMIYADYGSAASRLSTYWNDAWTQNWVHWAYVKKGNETRLYKDNILTAIKPVTTTYRRLNQSLDLGLWFNGSLDDLRIWGVARTEQEISGNMNHELTGTEPGLLGYWKFNENTGTVLKDSTPNGNNGFIKGAKWENAQPLTYVEYVRTVNPNAAVWGSFDAPQGTVSGVTKGWGWFLDPQGVAKVEILVDGEVKTTATYGIYRPDVYNAHPSYLNKYSGFEFMLDTTTLTNGTHTLSARETNNLGKQYMAGNTRTITVAN
ncbi:MAG TPA: LamG-like jellyroll fold domain-containing protein [Bacillota bacterium]|nr:LamG-like jellyroll fold domain-containing protein [Bacillota bacterium]